VLFRSFLRAPHSSQLQLNPQGAFLWVTLFSTISFLFAMYGLSLLMRATKMHLTTTMISGRYLALIFALLGSGVASLIFNILTATGSISCTADAPAKQIAAGRIATRRFFAPAELRSDRVLTQIHVDTVEQGTGCKSRGQRFHI